MPPTFLHSISQKLSAAAEFKALSDQAMRTRGRAQAICVDAGHPIAVAAASIRLQRPILVLTPNPDSAQRLVDQLPPWLGLSEEASPHRSVLHFVETEGIPFERYQPDSDPAHQRLATLDALNQTRVATATDAPAPLVVASINAAAEKTLSTESFEAAVQEIRTGDRIDVSTTARRWVEAGYELMPMTEEPGTFSRRGGILDIFPIGANEPLRIELFDDEVESIRPFNVETQRSNTKSIDTVRIVPAREELPALVNPNLLRSSVDNLVLTNMDLARLETQRIISELESISSASIDEDLPFYGGFLRHGTIFDFIPSDTAVIIIRPRMASETSISIDRRNEDMRRVKERRGEVPLHFPLPVATWPNVAASIEGVGHRIELNPFGIDDKDLGRDISLPIQSPELLSNSSPKLHEGQTGAYSANRIVEDPIDPIRKTFASGAENVVVITSHSERLRELASAQDLASLVHEDSRHGEMRRDTVNIVPGYATSGFALDLAAQGVTAVLTDSEVFGVRKRRRSVRRRSTRKTPRLGDLQPGVYVVHIDHGIARFLGTEIRQNDGREHLILQYARDDRVYIPTEYMDRIQIYQGGGDTAPRLSRLGTQEWKSARNRAKRATEEVASELLTLYAARTLSKGLTASVDTPWQQALDTSFPYEETPDQLLAIEAVKKEMESGRAMDRIICGDVGFGKTEIALRAAFKAVQSGRQVALLVPTTLLSQQHFETFTERLAPFPVSIESLSRFKSTPQQKEIIKRLASGELDIVIGTHRLIQRDVRIKNLGLVIIDEEQKFGVQHKEYLKRLRTEVDVLTLSATPIPRTLYLSLAGIRDMSNIETPPEQRVPIRTFVSEYSEDLIRQAILREIDRGGQAFFLHNRVKNIERVTAELRRIVPEATFVIGHGQMPEGELETVIAEFEDGQYDVLVCTTIIEAGIDMPKVNTLIVNNADRFGLAQLHHIRGRVGRSTSQAFSYLLVPPGKSLTEEADARLNTILTANKLGAGYEIAMRDLEIRGMGNVIGAAQSGHVTSVGLHLYTQLLAQSVEELKRRRNTSNSDNDDTLNNGSGPESKLNHSSSGENGIILPTHSRADVRLGLDDRIPEEYIEDLTQRLAMYQRISWCTKPEELQDLRIEFRDRFGPPPRNVEYLLENTRIKLLAEESGIDAVRVRENRALLILQQPVGDAKHQLQRLLGENARVGNTQITITLDTDDEPEDWIDELVASIEIIYSFKQRIISLLQAH